MKRIPYCMLSIALGVRTKRFLKYKLISEKWNSLLKIEKKSALDKSLKFIYERHLAHNKIPYIDIINVKIFFGLFYQNTRRNQMIIKTMISILKTFDNFQIDTQIFFSQDWDTLTSFLWKSAIFRLLHIYSVIKWCLSLAFPHLSCTSDRVLVLKKTDEHSNLAQFCSFFWTIVVPSKYDWIFPAIYFFLAIIDYPKQEYSLKIARSFFFVYNFIDQSVTSIHLPGLP